VRYQHFIYPLAGAIQPLHHPLWSIGAPQDGERPLPAECGSANDKPRSRDATAWLLHRLNVAAGLPRLSAYLGPPEAQQAEAPGRVLDVAELLQRKGVREALTEVVREQQQYHQRRHSQEDQLHERLKLLAQILFVATLAFVVARIFIFDVALNFLVVFLPAFAAALYGVSTQLEPHRVANQADTQQQNLTDILKYIDEAPSSPNNDLWETAIELRRLLIHAADLMRAEFVEWRDLVRSHQLEP